MATQIIPSVRNLLKAKLNADFEPLHALDVVLVECR